MAHTGEGGSSKWSVGDKMKGPWKEESTPSHHDVGPSSYRLFPGILPSDQPQTHIMLSKQDNPRSEVLTLDLPKVTQLPFQAMKQPICLPEREDIDVHETFDMNVPVQMSNYEDNLPVSPCGSNSWFSNSLATQVTLMNHGRIQSSYPPSLAPEPVEGSLQNFTEIMTVQKAYLCALQDPDQITPTKLLHQSPQALTDHYAYDICRMSHSWEITRQPQGITGFSQMQHSRRVNINHSDSVQQQMRYPVDNTFKIMSNKGKIASLCANPNGRHLIEHALESATPDEIIMVYEEVIPYARMLTVDVSANYVVQKLLDHGPRFYQREFIGNLIGHILPLSLHIYGCRVVQKAFEVADHDLKVQMANEFCGKVLDCARDQYANRVLQKCMECVPPQHIQFIFRSFCRKVKEFATTPYGCLIIQKVLTFCNNPQIYGTIVSEIIEAAANLASDPFGNYVVQHVVEHGGPVERATIVKQFGGRILRLSYQKYSSNVIEKCLAVGSFHDRQLITNEILNAGDGQHFDNVLDMMCHLYANYVIKKLVTTADEEQFRVLVEVARRNMDTIMRFPHGKQVLAHIQKVLIDRISQARSGY